MNGAHWFLAPKNTEIITTLTLRKLIVDPSAPEGPRYLAPALSLDADVETSATRDGDTSLRNCTHEARKLNAMRSQTLEVGLSE